MQGAGTAAGPAVPSTADGERSSPEPPGGRRPAAAGGGLCKKRNPRRGMCGGQDGGEMGCPLPHGLVQGAGTAAGPAVPGTADGERSSPEPPGGRRPAAAGAGSPYPAGMEKPPAMRSGVVCTVIPPAAHPWGGSPDRRGSEGYRPDGR